MSTRAKSKRLMLVAVAMLVTIVSVLTACTDSSAVKSRLARIATTVDGQRVLALYRAGAPVNGVVTDSNPKIKDQRGAANASPYADGWVLRMHSRNLREDLKHLMIGNEAEKFVKKEVKKLYRVVEETAGPLAADGGYLTDDIYGKMPEMGWRRLTKSFLRT